MPANLTPQYYEAERVYKEAKMPQEKIDAIEAMLAVMPKHKGTDKLKADLRRKISQLKKEMTKKHGSKKMGIDIKKEGAGQIVVTGLPNTGKSTIVNFLTGVEMEIASYPFSTRKATPAMMNFKNVKIQLIDVPPFTDEFAETWLNNILRNSDALAIVIDLSIDPTKEYEEIMKKLEQFKITPVEADGKYEEDVIKKPKRILLVGNKIDLEDSEIGIELLKEDIKNKFPLIAVSTNKKINMEELRRALFDLLNIVRVYSKPPGKKPNYEKPFTIEKGSSVMDFAARVHKDFKANLYYARIWGKDKYDGQRVNRDYIVQDEDIIELKMN